VINPANQEIAVGIVPHTHWDREWYLPFQTFRVRLVGLLDGLLDLLENDPSYERFLLDGQTAVIDDYLAVRPEAADRIKKLARAGRLQVGPWMILMDEYMVSGETLVRNLQFGIARASELGGLMEAGYLPDMFGHVAQMPQILTLAGLNDAIVWRGVPYEIDQTAFWWEAPNGSRVRAEYLIGSYSNGRDLPTDADGLIARAHGYEQELGSARLNGGGMLLMNGTDHQLPQRSLGDIVAQANSRQANYRFSITTLPDYLAQQPRADLAVWSGELRSGARANVLMGVASNRVDVHRAAAQAERALERRAEPLNALYRAPENYPDSLLAIAWKILVLNSAHDSSCACSSDEVVDAVMVRYQEARQIGDALVDEARHCIADRAEAPAGATVVINPTARTRGGLLEVRVPGQGPVHFVTPDGIIGLTQILEDGNYDRVGFSTLVVGQKIRWVLDMIRGPEFAGVKIGSVTSLAVGPNDWEYTFHAVAPNAEPVDLEPWRDELLARGGEGATLRIRQIDSPVRKLLVATPPVAGYGWLSLTAVEGVAPNLSPDADVVADLVADVIHTTDTTLANANLTVTADTTTGRLTITTPEGVTITDAHRLVDGGDGGDTYNYSPPTVDHTIDHPVAVEIKLVESGPVRARLLITTVSAIPAAAIGDEHLCSQRGEEMIEQKIETTVELRHNERFVRLHVEIDNRARDHRLRAHLPLPAPVTHSHAECAFTVVRRELEAQGGPSELGLPTFVSRRFVDCSDGSVGCAIIHDGLLEYEVLTDARGAGTELALTLLRATGYLSRADAAFRPNPAGPLTPLTGPQMIGTLAIDYAILPHLGDWRTADLYGAADEFLVPLERTRGRGANSSITSAPPLRIEGAEVSAVTRIREALVVRVFNPATEPRELRIIQNIDDRGETEGKGKVIDLRGNEVGEFTGTRALAPHEILTVRLARG